MELKKAIERLSKEKEQLSDAIECSLSGTSERNDWGGLVQAIDTVLAELKESKKEGKWKPKYDDIYFYIGDSGIITKRYWGDNQFDEWRYKNTAIFKTEKECERYKYFMDTVKEKSYEFPLEDWRDKDFDKYEIYYDRNLQEFIILGTDNYKVFGGIYFRTREDAQYIIDNFKEELLKYWI